MAVFFVPPRNFIHRTPFLDPNSRDLRFYSRMKDLDRISTCSKWSPGAFGKKFESRPIVKRKGYLKVLLNTRIKIQMLLFFASQWENQVNAGFMMISRKNLENSELKPRTEDRWMIHRARIILSSSISLDIQRRELVIIKAKAQIGISISR